MKEQLQKAGYYVVLAVLIVGAMYGLVTVAKFIGFASHDAQGGYVTELILEFTESQTYYGAIAGVAVRVAGFTTNQSVTIIGNEIEKENLLFDCLNPDGEQEIYASVLLPGALDLSTVFPATYAEIDSYFGTNGSSITSASNTYNQNFTITVGTQTVNAPGTTSYGPGLIPSNFTTVILKDNIGNLFFGSILTNFTGCFDTGTCNYQMLLPVSNGTNQTYNFWRDPDDTCPAGEAGGREFATLIGNVSDDSGNRLENVIVDVAGYTTLSDVTGFYNLTTIDGTYNIFAIKEGYQTYQANVTLVAGNVTIHNIVMVPEVVPNPNTGTGTGVDAAGTQTQTGIGPGQDVGPGEAPPTPLVEQPKKIEGTDYVISISEINRKIRVGSFVQEVVRFFSFKSSTAQVFLQINGSVADLVEIDKNELLIDPDGSDEMTLTIFGRGNVGVYNGSLIISGDMNATIPIEIEILTKDKLPVEALVIDVETSEKSYTPKSMVKFKTDLKNMLTEKSYPVTLFFTVQNEVGDETIWTYNTNVFLRTSFSIIKSFELPKTLEPGDYILRVSANYLGLSSGTSTIFKVELAWYKRLIFGRLPVWLLLVILAVLGTGVWLFFYIRKKIEDKKRYHLKVDYDTLPKPGPRSIFVGKIAETDHRNYFNMEKFKTHTIVAGSTGGGKSVSAQLIIEEMLEKDVAVVVFDPTAQWSGMLRKCKDKGMLSLYSFFGMKPSEAKAYNGNIREITDAKEVVNPMDYAKPGEIQVFACHRLDPRDMDIVVASAIREMFRSNLQESKPLRMMLVFDEVHRLLPKFGGSGQGFLQIERACREFRKWGLGVMLVSQVLSDFVGTIKANINTEIQMRTRDEGDLERIRQKYGEEVLRSLVMATIGTGMVENPAYNNGKPFFTAFRPLLHSTERLSDEEISEYTNYNNQIDELQYSLKQLEEKEVDVFDLKLELKLALDKVKTGNFNVVNVYLEGLTPRIEKEWQKLGLQPKKLQKKLVSIEELEAEFQSAKKESQDYAKEQESKEKTDVKEEKGPPDWNKEVTPDKILNLVNGMIVLSQPSLFDEISAMKDEDFEKHVNDNKNDFADWIYKAIGDEELANHMRLAKEKSKILELLEARKNKQDLPELTEEQKKELTEVEVFEKMAEEGAKSPETPAEEKKEPVEAEPAAEPKKTETVPEVASEKPERVEPATEQVEPSQPAEDFFAETVSEKPETTKIPSQETPTIEAPPVQTRPVTNEEIDADPGDAAEKALEAAINAGQSGLEGAVNDPSKYFKLSNGKEIKSLEELKNYLREMPDEMFYEHVGDNYNHFADWISGVFNAEEKANNIRNIKDKNQMAEAL